MIVSQRKLLIIHQASLAMGERRLCVVYFEEGTFDGRFSLRSLQACRTPHSCGKVCWRKLRNVGTRRAPLNQRQCSRPKAASVVGSRQGCRNAAGAEESACLCAKHVHYSSAKTWRPGRMDSSFVVAVTAVTTRGAAEKAANRP